MHIFSVRSLTHTHTHAIYSDYNNISNTPYIKLAKTSTNHWVECVLHINRRAPPSPSALTYPQIYVCVSLCVRACTPESASRLLLAGWHTLVISTFYESYVRRGAVFAHKNNRSTRRHARHCTVASVCVCARNASMKSLAIARIFALTVFKVCVCVCFFSVCTIFLRVNSRVRGSRAGLLGLCTGCPGSAIDHNRWAT